MEYIIECKEKNLIRYIGTVLVKDKLEDLFESNPNMTYAELADMSTFSEYQIRRELGLIQ